MMFTIWIIFSGRDLFVTALAHLFFRKDLYFSSWHIYHHNIFQRLTYRLDLYDLERDLPDM